MGKLFGLIGYPLSHSFSKEYFTQKFNSEAIDAHYELFPITSIDHLLNLIATYPDLNGLNVTIPYKQQIIPFLNELSPEAGIIGAVNTVKIFHEGNNIKLKGFNTDAPAFESELLKFIPHPGPSAQFSQSSNGYSTSSSGLPLSSTGRKAEKAPDKTALILGTGGAAAAVSYVLKKLRYRFLLVSRRRKPPVTNDALNAEASERAMHISYNEITDELIHNTSLIVNCSPVGMYPNTNVAPALPYHLISDKHYLFDLVYNPEKTEFMRMGAEHGAKTINGLGMLYKQAQLAWEIWNINN